MSSTEKINLSRLGSYILCWLVCHPKGGTARGIAVVLFKEQGREAEQLRLVGEELAAFKKAGLIKPERQASFLVTPSGHQAALVLLHWEKITREANWRNVKGQLDKCLLEEKTPPPVAPDVALPEASAVRLAQILVIAFQLDLVPKPTLPQVVDALAWFALGIKTREPFTAPAVSQVLLNRLADTPMLLPSEQVLEMLAAKAGMPAPITPPRSNGAVQSAPLPADDAAFAARVLAAARASKTGRFGGDKVFISHVLRRLADEGAAVDDAEALKTRLVSAHRRGLLSLSRADLVEAMDPEDVSASEARYLSATFHFVRI